MQQLDKSNINIIEDGISIVDFWSPTCPSCIEIKRKIEAIENNYKNVNFYSVDTSINKSIAIKYKILSIPSVLIIKNGIELKRISKRNIHKLEEYLEKYKK